MNNLNYTFYIKFQICIIIKDFLKLLELKYH